MKTSSDINEITALTELLALNATMEAVRMGKTGEGFANVAEELKAITVDTVDLIQQQPGNKARNSFDENENTIEHAINDQLQATEELFTSLNGLDQTKLESEQSSKQGIMDDLDHLKLTLKTGLDRLS